MLHHLKTLPTFYQAVIDGKKPFEIRNNDRNFKSGDYIILEEWNNRYTGRYCEVIVKDIFDISFLFPGYVAFTFKILKTWVEIESALERPNQLKEEK